VVDAGQKYSARRVELALDDLPSERLLVDVGAATVERYTEELGKAATIFVNGPAGVYEQEVSAVGTQQLWTAVADAGSSGGYSVIGGGDSVAAARRFGVLERMGYVCTSGGGMVRFLSGQTLPVVEALRRSARRQRGEGEGEWP
jgi:phosphoglycerate kinase